jgi:Tetrapyrrole (Corrin/Porphyrin) Methylases
VRDQPLCNQPDIRKEAGIPVEVIPGITAAQACAAAAGAPLTHRGLATGVRYLTGHRRLDSDLDFDWRSLSDPETTLVVYMGLPKNERVAALQTNHGLSSFGKLNKDLVDPVLWNRMAFRPFAHIHSHGPGRRKIQHLRRCEAIVNENLSLLQNPEGL